MMLINQGYAGGGRSYSALQPVQSKDSGNGDLKLNKRETVIPGDIPYPSVWQ